MLTNVYTTEEVPWCHCFLFHTTSPQNRACQTPTLSFWIHKDYHIVIAVIPIKLKIPKVTKSEQNWGTHYIKPQRSCLGRRSRKSRNRRSSRRRRKKEEEEEEEEIIKVIRGKSDITSGVSDNKAHGEKVNSAGKSDWEVMDFSVTRDQQCTHHPRRGSTLRWASYVLTIVTHPDETHAINWYLSLQISLKGISLLRYKLKDWTYAGH